MARELPAGYPTFRCGGRPSGTLVGKRPRGVRGLVQGTADYDYGLIVRPQEPR